MLHNAIICQKCGQTFLIDPTWIKKIAPNEDCSSLGSIDSFLRRIKPRLYCSKCHSKEITIGFRQNEEELKNKPSAPVKNPKRNRKTKNLQRIDYIAVVFCNYCDHKMIYRRKDLEQLSTNFKIPLTNAFVKNLHMYSNKIECKKCGKKDVEIIVEDNDDNNGDDMICKKCGAPMVWRIRQNVSPTKYFLGCSNYPKCKYIVSGSW